MISEKKLNKMLSDIDLSKKLQADLYNSVIESITYTLAGNALYYLLIKVEKECQWPVLQKLGNPNLNIYQELIKGYNNSKSIQNLIKEFIHGIKLEKEIRKDKKAELTVDKIKHHSHVVLRAVIRSRVRIFETMFNMTNKDMIICNERADELRNDYNLRRKKRLKF